MIPKLLAEALGTMFLLLSIVGSAIMAATLFPDHSGLQLLVNAAATGLALYVLIAIFMPISGAHFNPVVSLAMLLEREMKAPEALAFILVQIAAAVSGVILAHALYDDLPLVLSQKSRSSPELWLSEIFATFGLVLLILLARIKTPAAIPALVGAYIAGGYWFTPSSAFANPAVTLGRILSDSPSGIAAASVPMYLICQIIGALLAILAARVLLRQA